MTSVPTSPDHPDTHVLQLGWEEIVAALTALEGSRVAIRIVERSDPETLVAVFRGHLGALSDGKHPTLFWPVRAVGEDEAGDVEDTGIHLRRDRFQTSVASLGHAILHIVQGPVIVNVRRV